MGAGAWGTAPSPPEEEEAPKAPSAPQQQFGASYRANPVAAPSPLSATGGGSSIGPSPSFQQGPLSASKEEQLRRKEAELIERERRVAEREAAVGAGGKIVGPKNWPICYPIWRHSIPEDIPEGSRRVVREAYVCWWALIGCLSYQFFCASVMLGYGVSNKVPSWFLAIIFFVLGVPLSIWLWYMRLYRAARDESKIGFAAYLFFFFLHFAFCVFCSVGPQIFAAQWCFSGFLAGFDAFNAGAFPGTIYMIGGGLWGALAFYSLWVFKDSWYFFRGRGGVEQVKQEAALAAFKIGMQQQGPPAAANGV